MSKLANLSGPGAIVAGGVVAMVVVVAGIALWGRVSDISAPEPAPQPVAVAPAPASQPQTGTGPDRAEAPAQAETPPASAQSAPEPATEPDATPPQPPEFALVRVEPDGFTQIAGTAVPGGTVEMLLDGAVVGAATAGSDGSFAALIDLPPSDAPRVMSLRMAVDGAELESEQEIIIAPTVAARAEVAPPADDPDRAEDVAADAAVESSAGDEPETMASAEPQQPQPEATGDDDTGAAIPAPVTAPGGEQTVARAAPQPGAETEPEPAPAAQSPQIATDPAPGGGSPAVLLSDAEGVRVLQPSASAEATTPEIMATVAIDAITYSESGAVELAGRSPDEGFVRVYLDNTPVTTSPIAPDGSWRTELPQVDTGIYTLRVDQVNAAGEVVSRVETPFKREDAEALSAATADAAAGAVRAITVQPGNTLWAIARDRYGEGTAYVRVFEANRDRIRDPDLIYPGQVFDLPAE